MGNFLAKLFGQGVKTINSLPVDLLRKVLVNLDTYRDLLASRGVCTQWRLVVESICRDKSSVIICDVSVSDVAQYDFTHLYDRFNNLVDFKPNSVRITVKGSLSQDLVILLAKLLPNVRNLAVEASLDSTTGNAQNVLYLLNQWSTTIVTLQVSLGIFHPSHPFAMYDHLDKLISLRRLHFTGGRLIIGTMGSYARLQHIHAHEINIEDVSTLIGPAFTSFNLVGTITMSTVTRWLQFYPAVVGRLTHLSFTPFKRKVFRFVCAHFRALQHLSIIFRNELTLNSGMIVNLARLNQLVHLKLEFLLVDLPSLARTNVAQLNSVQSLVLNRFNVHHDGTVFSGDQFCRVLAAIFPNLVQLTIMTWMHHEHIKDGISQHVNHFAHLRKFIAKRYDTW